jgi:hypothetical protein
MSFGKAVAVKVCKETVHICDWEMYFVRGETRLQACRGTDSWI